MALSIKLDENMPADAKDLLSRLGHDAASVVQQDMVGWKDPDVWSAVQKEQRLLVTADKAFADLRRYPPGTHAGVLLLRPDIDGIEPILRLLQLAVAAVDLETLAGTVTVVTPRSVRIKRHSA